MNGYELGRLIKRAGLEDILAKVKSGISAAGSGAVSALNSAPGAVRDAALGGGIGGLSGLILSALTGKSKLKGLGIGVGLGAAAGGGYGYGKSRGIDPNTLLALLGIGGVNQNDYTLPKPDVDFSPEKAKTHTEGNIAAILGSRYGKAVPRIAGV